MFFVSVSIDLASIVTIVNYDFCVSAIIVSADTDVTARQVAKVACTVSYVVQLVYTCRQ